MNHHFPNELLKDSTKVVRAVWDKLRALQARDANGGSIDEERKDMGLYVMADTTYGSCVDEVGTAHINAECVIHYGHTCLSPGLTSSNYTELSKLYEKYKTQGLEILAFPCNQFGGQEPGSNPEIKNFACTSFKVEFPIFDKVDVNGLFTAPVYQFLKSSSGGFLGDLIKWNFEKFLVDKNGKVVERYPPTTSPFQIEKDIQKLLAA